MASVVATASDALRVEAVFHNRQDLAGLIWEAEDRWDHPLLAYETGRDFRHTQLRFRWRSDGVKPLDALHGPTLTIEGRDAGGAPRAGSSEERRVGKECVGASRNRWETVTEKKKTS